MSVELYDQPFDGKDYIIQIKVRNGPLFRAIRRRGLTIRRLAELSSVSVHSVYEFLRLSRAPVGKKGWHGSALKIATALGLPPDSLWPEQHLEHALRRSNGEIEVSSAEINLLMEQEQAPRPDEELERKQLALRVHQALLTLTGREERIIRLRFGLDGPVQTLEEVGEQFGVTGQRIRDIESKALRKLKHPRRSNPLREVSDIEPLGGLTKRRHLPPIDFEYPESFLKE